MNKLKVSLVALAAFVALIVTACNPGPGTDGPMGQGFSPNQTATYTDSQGVIHPLDGHATNQYWYPFRNEDGTIDRTYMRVVATSFVDAQGNPVPGDLVCYSGKVLTSDTAKELAEPGYEYDCGPLANVKARHPEMP